MISHGWGGMVEAGRNVSQARSVRGGAQLSRGRRAGACAVRWAGRLLPLLLCLWLTPAAFAGGCDGRVVAEHILGAPVCVPDQPQRVVVLDPYFSLGMARELGVAVVGAPLSTAADAAVVDGARQAGVVDIGDFRQPSLEKIIALKPDLIIGIGQMHGELRERVARIAPTVLITADDWKAHYLALGAATGQMEAAQQNLDAYEARAAALRARAPEQKVSVIRIAPYGFQVYLDGPKAYAPYAVLREAGVKRTAYETTTDDTVFRRPDWEALAALDGDVILYVVVNAYDPAKDDALAAETLNNPLWQMLPAARAGHVHRLERGAWMGFNSVASAHRILDDVERYILAERPAP